jgi:hypothetical protein
MALHVESALRLQFVRAIGSEGENAPWDCLEVPDRHCPDQVLVQRFICSRDGEGFISGFAYADFIAWRLLYCERHVDSGVA